MNCHCFQGQEEGCLEHTCLDGDKLDMSNGMVTVNKLSDGESLTDCCPMPQFTAISEHSLVKGSPQDIEDWLISLPRVSHANHFQPLDDDVVKPTSEICGVQQSNVSASYDRDMCYWKMCQGYLLQDTSGQFSETWLKAGMIVGGEYFPQQKWALPINEIDYGSLLPTPAAQEPGINADRLVDKHGDEPTYWNQRLYDRHTGRYAQRGLTQYAQMYPTSQSRDWKGSSGRSYKGQECDLPTVARMYQTPTVHDALEIKRSEAGWQKRIDYRKSIGRDHIAPGGLSEQVWMKENDIPLQISKLPTPRSGGDVLCGGSGHKKMLQGTDLENNRNQLNPKWTEWLMGWVPNWTSLEPLDKEVYEQWLNQSITGEMWLVDPSSVPELDTPRLIEPKAKDRRNRLKAIGNGQVPLSAAIAWLFLTGNYHPVTAPNHRQRRATPKSQSLEELPLFSQSQTNKGVN